MGKLIAAFMVLVLIGGGLYYYNHTRVAIDAPAQEEASAQATYFQQRLFDVGVERIGGMPIEGFDATMLLQAFPGLQPQDFNGVESFEGIYTYTDDSLNFERTRTNPVSSAERTVSAAGYETLLTRVAARLGLPAQTTEQIDSILIVLAPSNVPVDEERSAEIETRIGQGASALDVKVTPRAIVEDSRCPQDVQCIWAGTVKVEVDLESGMGKATETMQINVPITTEAEVVTLTEVRPAKISTGELQPSQYEFVFKIEKRATR